MAIERERHERSLAAALAHHKVLLKEMNHRVKNSLAIVSSMLHLQAKRFPDHELTAQLKEASDRIVAVARAHELLYQGSDLDWLDIGRYIERICKDYESSGSHIAMHVSVDYGIEIATDRAISCALIVNELISNATKYAYPEKRGTIWVTVIQAPPDRISISVRDEGVGFPPDFDISKSNGLGMRLILAFVQQLNASLEVRHGEPGTELVVLVPTKDAAGAK
jgi:two-component sensor histidine kinase